MEKLIELVYKKYKNAPFTDENFKNLCKKALFFTNTKMQESNISKDILFMNELDKQICLFIKEQIYEEDIDSEIYIVEKYKYLFKMLKLDYLSNGKKEKIIVNSLKEYNGEILFSQFLIRYLKERYINNNKKKKIVNIQKLKKLLLSQKEIEEQKDELDYLYLYFFDLEELLDNDNISDKEKIVILLKFGYIDSHFCSIKMISEILNQEKDLIEFIYQKNQKKLKKEYYKSLEEHHLNK